jgi:hypothetical protein
MEGRTFKPEIYEGLQLPAKVRPVREKVKVVVLEPKLTNDEIKAKEGAYFTEADADTIYEEDVDVYGLDAATGKKKLLARFRKHVIPLDLIKQGWEAYYQTAAASRNRGAAAGPIDLKSNYWKKRNPVEVQGWSARYKQDGKTSKMRGRTI